MLSYPNYIPPASGYTGPLDPSFYGTANHIGVLDVMTWKTGDIAPSSSYHPIYQHNITDVNSAYRMAVNATSIEMGIGKGIANVAKFANANNLGTANQRVGVGYFLNIGYNSGTWWTNASALQNTIIRTNYAVKSAIVDTLKIYSGYISNNFHLSLTNSNTNLTLTGPTFIDTLIDSSKIPTWSFQYGTISAVSGINLFNNKFIINSNASGLITNDIIFTNSLTVSNLNLPVSGRVSGFHSTYNPMGVTDNGVINYSISGHTHNSSGWLQPVVDYPISGNTIFDNRYYYNFNDTVVLTFDSLGTSNSWTILNNKITTPTSNSSRVFKDSTNLNFMNSGQDIYLGLLPYSILGDKKATANNLIYSVRVGNTNLSIHNTNGIVTQITLPCVVSKLDEFYYFDNNLYFVQVSNGAVYINKINNFILTFNSISITGYTYVSSYVCDSEIFIILYEDNNTYLFRYNDIEKSTFVALFFTNSVPSQVAVIEQLFVTVCDTSVIVFSINNPKKSYTLFQDIDSSQKLSVYQNTNYIFVQFGSYKRMIRTNASTSLSLDSITGIMNLGNNIHIIGSLHTDSIIFGFVVGSLYANFIPIYNDNYLLNTTNQTYINRFVYNKLISNAFVYNDVTCGQVFQGKFYFGHRGALSIFSRQSNDTFTDPISSPQQNIIPVRFLALNDSMLMLVQDFNNAIVDFVLNQPNSPYAADQQTNQYGSNSISYIPGPWSVPLTRIYQKDKSSETWNVVKNFTEAYGNNIIDAITYDNNLYILCHDPNSTSGIISVKYQAGKYDAPTSLTCSGTLPLNESFVGSSQRSSTINQFIPTSDGRFTTDGNGNYTVTTSPNINGFNKFYMYNHPNGPYVVHDTVELLVDTIQANSIYSSRSSWSSGVIGYAVSDTTNKFNYRTLNISFLNKPESRINTVNTNFIQMPDRDINNPNWKIPLYKDNPNVITSSGSADKYNMKDVANNSDRSQTHFITSVTLNKVIYLIIQVNQTLQIYSLRNLSDFQFKIPGGISTVCGTGYSYAGCKYNDNWINKPYSMDTSTAYSMEYIPCTLENLLCTQIDLTKLLPVSTNLYVMGDGDDLFIQNPLSTNYRYNKRYATQSNLVIGGSLYLPLTCRDNHPTGPIYSFMLGFFSDGTISIVDKNDIPMQIIQTPLGRVQFAYKDGRFITSALRLEDGEPLTVTYKDIVANPTYGTLITKSNPNYFNDMYNAFGEKRWVIGEYDVKINDNLNMRELL